MLEAEGPHSGGDVHLVCDSKYGFEAEALFTCGILVKGLGTFASAANCYNVRQGEAVFVKVDNELCLGDGKTDGRCVTGL